MEWYQWFFIFIIFGIFFSLAFFFFAQYMITPEKRKIHFLSILFFLLLSFLTMWVGIKYAEEKMRESVIDELLDKEKLKEEIEKHFKQKEKTKTFQNMYTYKTPAKTGVLFILFCFERSLRGRL